MRTLTKTDGTPLTLEQLLGAGGQGEVWRARDDGSAVAVKLYHRHTASAEQRAALERLVDKGPPADQFLWPLAMVNDPDKGTFGYVMPLRPPRFRPLEDFMARRIHPSMKALLTAGLGLADAFLRLHSRGLCYRDISFANVFFDPKTGDVLVCDNDNVDISGSAAGGVLGTPRFMAPEVVRREADPSDKTDRYSLAVLLFYLLYGGHPLDGAREARIRCLDVPALEKLYGTDPLYIWDPDDDSNRPVPGVHDNPIAFQPMYPRIVADAFERSFTTGLSLPTKRVRESQWRKILQAAVDSIWRCRCGAESFYEPSDASGGATRHCWSCRRGLQLPPRIKLDDRVVLLDQTTVLSAHHLGEPREESAPAAEVVPHPTRKDVFGLRNLTGDAWTLAKPDGATVNIPPGRAAPIRDGYRIHFGRVTGVIRG